MLTLGIDGGQRVLGWCVCEFLGSRRRVIDGGDLREAEAEDEYITWISTVLGRYPDLEAVGLEDHVWMGAERSANPQAFTISKLVGKLEGAIRMWAALNRPRLQVFVIRKSSCNASVGITGASSFGAGPKQRVKRATDTFFPHFTFANEHQRDAAVVCVATRARARRTK